MKKQIYDVADEIFDKTLKNPFATIKKIEKKHLSIYETNIKKNKNPYFKEKGIYCSFNFQDISSKENYNELKKYLLKYIKEFILILTKKKKPNILLVGLGNENYIPDSLGPSVIKNISINNFPNRKIGCLIPGVMAITGMETSDIIKGVLKVHDYDLVIAIDSLATSSFSRLNKTIQITNTGIIPGSGVKNYRKAINYSTLKVKVLTIGIATIIPYSKLFEEIISKYDIQDESPFEEMFLTNKDIENDISFLTLLLSEVIEEII